MNHGQLEVFGYVNKTTNAFIHFHFQPFVFLDVIHVKYTNGEVIVESEIKRFCRQVFDNRPNSVIKGRSAGYINGIQDAKSLDNCVFACLDLIGKMSHDSRAYKS